MGCSRDSQSSQEASFLEPPLPPKFECIQDILGIDNKRLEQTPMVNVIGLVRDYQPPIQTKGKDLKCSITLVDISIDYNTNGVKLVIFWPEERMPHITSLAEVVVLRNVKVQMWSGYISLLANYRSEIHVCPAQSIPSWPLTSRRISTKSGSLSLAESNYAVWLFNKLKCFLKDFEAFEKNTKQAMNITEKYSLLKSISADRYYDLIGEVIRIHDRNGLVTMYISDYTTHSLFYNNISGGGNDDSTSCDGDEYGYIKAGRRAVNNWPGPYGKLALQLTVYDDHAKFIREHVKISNWVLLENVHIKMSSSGFIEGLLHTDKQEFKRKIQVRIIRRSEDAEMNDSRWKAAVRRKREYWEGFKKQMKESGDSTNSNGKRMLTSEGAQKQSGRKRRKERRAAIEAKVLAHEQNPIKNLDLNMNIKCNYPDKDPKPIQEILQGNICIRKLESGLEYVLPFVNANYRANVRVIDFWPDNLEDFSVGRRDIDFDVLSDYSGGESTDHENDMQQYQEGKGCGGPKVWSWRFALRVEDANKKAIKGSEMMWLLIDDKEGQMLLDIDAVNLRQNGKALILLREQLFKLWGDLEERKCEYMKIHAAKVPEALPSSVDTEPESRTLRTRAKPGDELPPDSDDDAPPSYQQDNKSTLKPAALTERDPNIGSKPQPVNLGGNEKTISKVTDLTVSNKGFTCCIRQYGVKVPEDSPARADAGLGLRWERVYGMFGTRIT